MMMFNKSTNQQGEWVTIEGMEFLKVDNGNFISKDNVGMEWTKFDNQTTEMLLELVESVGRDDDISFMLLKHMGDGAQVIGHRLSDRMVLEFIMTLIEHFTEDDPIKTVMLMMAIQESILEDDE